MQRRSRNSRSNEPPTPGQTASQSLRMRYCSVFLWTWSASAAFVTLPPAS